MTMRGLAFIDFKVDNSIKTVISAQVIYMLNNNLARKNAALVNLNFKNEP